MGEMGSRELVAGVCCVLGGSGSLLKSGVGRWVACEVLLMAGPQTRGDPHRHTPRAATRCASPRTRCCFPLP